MNQYLGRDEYNDDDFAEGFIVYDTWTQTQADSWDDADRWLDAYAEAQANVMYDKEDTAVAEFASELDSAAFVEWLDTL